MPALYSRLVSIQLIDITYWISCYVGSVCTLSFILFREWLSSCLLPILSGGRPLITVLLWSHIIQVNTLFLTLSSIRHLGALSYLTHVVFDTVYPSFLWPTSLSLAIPTRYWTLFFSRNMTFIAWHYLFNIVIKVMLHLLNNFNLISIV